MDAVQRDPDMSRTGQLTFQILRLIVFPLGFPCFLSTFLKVYVPLIRNTECLLQICRSAKMTLITVRHDGNFLRLDKGPSSKKKVIILSQLYIFSFSKLIKM